MWQAQKAGACQGLTLTLKDWCDCLKIFLPLVLWPRGTLKSSEREKERWWQEMRPQTPTLCSQWNSPGYRSIAQAFTSLPSPETNLTMCPGLHSLRSLLPRLLYCEEQQMGLWALVHWRNILTSPMEAPWASRERYLAHDSSSANCLSYNTRKFMCCPQHESKVY